MKVLFQLEHAPGDDPAETLAYHAEEDGSPSQVVEFARGLVDGVLANRERIDQTIAGASTNWRLAQMAGVDRCILRIAVYEIAIARDVPVRAAINESIELAKTFSGEDAGRFVNGVLGRVAGADAEAHE